MSKKVNNNLKDPLMPMAKEMRIGEEKVYPIIRMASVKSAYSQTGLMYNRIFKSSTDRNSRTITMRRIK